MRLTCALAVLSAAMVFPSPYGAAERGERIQAAGEAAEPFRIIGNIYYVGGQYGSYLITTPEGHILHDTGTADMHALIVSNVEKLGFDAGDIRIMISSHAHWDHVEGHAAMKRATGAQVVALGGDAVALQSGRDNSAIGARDFEPVAVDRVIEDGDTVTLGGVTLRALWTGGHTQGATMWMTTAEEGGDTYSVAFRGGEIPNQGARPRKSRHPTGRPTQRTSKLKDSSSDLFAQSARCASRFSPTWTRPLRLEVRHLPGRGRLSSRAASKPLRRNAREAEGGPLVNQQEIGACPAPRAARCQDVVTAGASWSVLVEGGSCPLQGQLEAPRLV